VGRDGWTGLVVLATSLGLLWETFGIERSPMVPVSPAFYPRIVLAATAVLAVVMVVADLLARRARVTAPAKAEGGAGYGLVAAAFGVFSAYVLALPWVGFRIATLVFLVAMQALLEPPRSARRWAAVGALALAATVASYYVFEHYLHVLLPRGRWTDF